MRAALETELARIREVDAFATLGLAYEADDDDARAAFLAATKRLHPNRFARRDAETRRVANEVFLAVKKAYEAVQDREGRSHLLSRLGKGTAPEDAIEAEQPEPTPDVPATAPRPATSRSTARHRRAVSPRRRRPVRAVSTASPDELRQRVAAKEEALEAAYEAAKALLRGGKLVEAREAFRKLAVDHSTERRFRVWMHFAMGRVHAAEKDAERARDEYRRALALDESFEPARRSLAELPVDPPPTRKGLFSRLFKK